LPHRRRPRGPDHMRVWRKMLWKLRHQRFTRGLRFRLTLSYVLFFTLLLTVLGIFFRQSLASLYDSHTRSLLEEEWGAVKAYLRIDKGKVDWYYDPEDPDEAYSVERLKHVYILTDSKGNVLQVSPIYYQEIGLDDVKTIQAALRSKIPVLRTVRGSGGAYYMLRSGPFIDDNGKVFYVSIGRALTEYQRIVEQFTLSYFLFVPVMIASSSIMGWFVAKRTMKPLEHVARTARRITGSNLTAAIPIRGAGDELDRLIDAFNRMIERLNASFTMTRQFSTDVSHELRTPLTAIRGQLEVALLTADTAEQYRDAITDALQDVDRLSATIRAILLLSQAESGQLGLQKQVVDLSAIARDIVDQFQIPAEESKVKLEATLHPRCLLEADRVQMERLLSNLISNSVKYTPAGGRVHVEVSGVENQVQLVVEDTGRGIPKDHLAHIFDRFYRVPNSGPEKGLGLGLSFVAWIVKAHGGKIHVDSEPGNGTRFVITLPIGEAAVRELQSSEPVVAE
ncbi:MAG TPA: ATP-binding protein, partial [Bryobacteraceae bacterium]|nr:ATP-binding protein [Bryobacteraceae bacterium]